MNRDLRNQLLIAVASNVSIDAPKFAKLTAACVTDFVDALEELDDLHELRYEVQIIEQTRDLIRESIDTPKLRNILPAVMTFQAFTKTGSMSTLIIHLQAVLQETYKKINGPAATTKEDGEALFACFNDVLPKFNAQIAEMEAKVKDQEKKLTGA